MKSISDDALFHSIFEERIIPKKSCDSRLSYKRLSDLVVEELS